MSDVNLSMSKDPNFSLSLIPPDPSGDAYSNIAVQHGKASGKSGSDNTKEISKILGFSTTDTMSGAEKAQLDKLSSLASELNISLQLETNPTVATQLQLDAFDPAQPNIPIIAHLINVSKEMINDGNIGGFKVPSQQQDQNPVGIIPPENDGDESIIDKTSGKSGVSTDSKRGALNSDGTPNLKEKAPITAPVPVTVVPMGRCSFLAGNAYVDFLVTFMALVRQLKEMKMAQSKIEVTSMTLITAIAQDASDSIMNAARQEQIIHITAAVCAGVSAGVGVISLVGMAREFGAEEEVPTEETDAQFRDNLGNEEEPGSDKYNQLKKQYDEEHPIDSLGEPKSGDLKRLKEEEYEKIDNESSPSRRKELTTRAGQEYGPRTDEIEPGSEEERNLENKWNASHSKYDVATDEQLQQFKTEEFARVAKGKTGTLEQKYGEVDQKVEEGTPGQKENLQKAWQERQQVRQQTRENFENEVGPNRLVNKNGKTQQQVEEINKKAGMRKTIFQSLGTIGSQGGTLINESVQAAFQVPIAVQQGKQKMLDASQAIQQHILQSSTDAFKGSSDLISQLIGSLDQMRDKLASAISASLGAR